MVEGGVEDLAVGDAQHQLRMPSGGAASLDEGRQRHGHGDEAGSRAGAPTNPLHGGGSAAPSASTRRGKGGAVDSLAGSSGHAHRPWASLPKPWFVERRMMRQNPPAVVHRAEATGRPPLALG